MIASVWNRRLTIGQFGKLGMITIIDFIEMCGLVLVNFLFSIDMCGNCG